MSKKKKTVTLKQKLKLKHKTIEFSYFKIFHFFSLQKKTTDGRIPKKKTR